MSVRTATATDHLVMRELSTLTFGAEIVTSAAAAAAAAVTAAAAATAAAPAAPSAADVLRALHQASFGRSGG